MLEFIRACRRGHDDEVKRLYELNPAILNEKNLVGWTGLMWSLVCQHHSVSRWLLGRPGLDTALTTVVDDTALHCACQDGAPLDIVAQLAELSRRQGSLNLKDGTGWTAPTPGKSSATSLTPTSTSFWSFLTSTWWQSRHIQLHPPCR